MMLLRCLVVLSCVCSVPLFAQDAGLEKLLGRVEVVRSGVLEPDQEGRMWLHLPKASGSTSPFLPVAAALPDVPCDDEERREALAWVFREPAGSAPPVVLLASAPWSKEGAWRDLTLWMWDEGRRCLRQLDSPVTYTEPVLPPVEHILDFKLSSRRGDDVAGGATLFVDLTDSPGEETLELRDGVLRLLSEDDVLISSITLEMHGSLDIAHLWEHTKHANIVAEVTVTSSQGGLRFVELELKHTATAMYYPIALDIPEYDPDDRIGVSLERTLRARYGLSVASGTWEVDAYTSTVKEELSRAWDQPKGVGRSETLEHQSLRIPLTGNSSLVVDWNVSHSATSGRYALEGDCVREYHLSRSESSAIWHVFDGTSFIPLATRYLGNTQSRSAHDTVCDDGPS